MDANITTGLRMFAQICERQLTYPLEITVVINISSSQWMNTCKAKQIPVQLSFFFISFQCSLWKYDIA